jgi:predicted SAM-dependent methyltransferase
MENKRDLSARKYLAIGGGNFHQDGWINLDYPFERRAGKQHPVIDVEHNLMSMDLLPFPDNRFEIIYSEHCIEHLTEGAAKWTIKECHRILQPGGVLRISCPDAEKLFGFYKAGDFEKLITGKQGRGRSPEYNLIDLLYSPMAGIWNDEEIQKLTFEELADKLESSHISLWNQKENPGWHLSTWTHFKIAEYMQCHGFPNTTMYNVKVSTMRELTQSYIDRTAPEISLHVEGTKQW